MTRGKVLIKLNPLISKIWFSLNTSITESWSNDNDEWIRISSISELLFIIMNYCSYRFCLTDIVGKYFLCVNVCVCNCPKVTISSFLAHFIMDKLYRTCLTQIKIVVVQSRFLCKQRNGTFKVRSYRTSDNTCRPSFSLRKKTCPSTITHLVLP